MSLVFVMIAFGALMVYAGWKNLSLWALMRGDNVTAKASG